MRTSAAGARDVLPRFCAGAILLIAIVLLAPEALAQGAGDTVDAAIDRMADTLSTFGNRIGEAARSLLLILFTVDLVLRFGRWTMEGTSFAEVFGGWTYQLAFVSMVYVMALMAPQIVDQLTVLARRFAGLAAGLREPSASNLITDGLQQALDWVKSIRFFEPATWFFIFAAIVSIVVTAMTVAFLVIVYAEIYLVGLAGIIVLGLAGLQETRSAAIAYIRLLIGKALKLMALMIVYNAINTLTTALASADGVSLEAALGMIMLQVIGALLIVSLPASVEALVSGIGSAAPETAARFAGTVTRKVMTGTATRAAGIAWRAAMRKIRGKG